MSNNVYYACLMAVADAERYQRLTHSDNLRAALDDLYKVLPEGYVSGLPYVTNDFQIKHKASILQRGVYDTLTAYLPEENEDTIYNITTGVTVYAESDDKDIKNLQKNLSEMRVAAGKVAVTLNELNVNSRLHSKAAAEVEAEIRGTKEDPSSATVRALSASHIRHLSSLDIVNDSIDNVSKRLDRALNNIDEIEVQILQMLSYKQLKDLTIKTSESVKALDVLYPDDYSGRKIDASAVNKERAALDGLTEALQGEDYRTSAYRELDNLMLDEHTQKILGNK